MLVTPPAAAKWPVTLAVTASRRVAKAVLISAVPPIMVKTPNNPGGLPKEVFDGLQAQLAANRAQFYQICRRPVLRIQPAGREGIRGRHPELVAQGNDRRRKAHYDGIVAFSQTDFTADLMKITVPTLVMHGDDDQIVPYADAGPLTARIVENATLKTYKGFPHGMCKTEADTINADLLSFVKSQ